MKKLALAAAAVIALGAPAAAFAQPVGGYAGLGYTHFNDDDVGADYSAVTGRFGYRFHPNLGVEGEATIGTNDDVNAELDNAFGVYGVGYIPMSPNFDLLGRVGYERLNVNGRGPLAGANLDDDGVAYGVGAQYNFVSGWSVRGDYTRFDSDRETNIWGASVQHSF